MDNLSQLEDRVKKMISTILELKERVSTLESENKKLFEIKAEISKRVDSIIKKLSLLPDEDKGA